MRKTAAMNFSVRLSIRRTIATILTVAMIVSTDLLAAAESPELVLHDTRQNEFVRALSGYEVVTPARVHETGDHLSHHVIHHLRADVKRRKRRSAAFWEEEGGSDDGDWRVHYKVTVDGNELHLELTPTDYLFAPGLVVERRRRGTRPDRNATASHGDARVERITHNKCHFAGKVKGRPESTVAIATCDGLHGYIHTGERDYFIEPVKGYNQSLYVGHPHLIYRRSALPAHLLPSADSLKSIKEQEGSCGVIDENQVPDAVDAQRAMESRAGAVGGDGNGVGGRGGGGDDGGRSGRRRRKRSISLERNVETLVVVDKHMMDYHKNENIENYILTIMNMVATMYHDATTGNAINIVLVRIIYLEEEEKDLVIQTHADHTLSSFCKWQASINQKDDKHPNHHDVAILLTRLDICSRSTEPCSTLGLSQVSGMCQDHRSCNINQDTGLALAFTVTHELGHNFGMQHDTAENGCEPRLHWLQYIMAPQLTAEASPLVWSNCSRKAVTAFLDRDWGYCLEDEPSDHEFDFPVLPPGVMYDIDHQCRLQYGPDAGYCEGIDDLCATVWCRVENKCLTRLEAAAEGTLCGDNEWCYGGRCIAIGEKPLAIDSHWGEWGSWSECSRTCGAGVSHSERLCNNPPPSHGGRYCLGERKRFRICNTQPCREGSPSFREHQCAEFNNVPYKGQRHQWEPVATPSTPCQLHCKPRGRYYFSVMLKDVVTDGTPCKTGKRNMCISGRCRVVGCDWGIESDAVEDACGVCHGDGTTCTKVTESFDKKSGLGYVEATVIPEGARNIRVEEVAEANNYLAIRNDRGHYYLNGHWFIQWSGDYEVAGTVVEYRREGNKESIFTIGPIKEPLHLMLLFQSQNPGIKFEYTVLNENATDKRRPEFHWKYADWTHCTTSCGGGSQTSQVVCVEKEAGIVEDKFCNISIKPDDMHMPCNDHLCPARWWHGLWQHCSVSCGENGYRRRTVLCVRQLGPDEQIALEDWECESLEKPLEVSECKHKEPCPVEDTMWKVGPWSEVCRNDPCGRQNRSVECINSFGYCDLSVKPSTERPCPQALCGQWKAQEWSKCTKTCEGGFQFRSVTCVGGRACPHMKPAEEQPCNEQSCSLPLDAAETNLLSSSSSPIDSSRNGIFINMPTSNHSPNESSWQPLLEIRPTEFSPTNSPAMVTMVQISTAKSDTRPSVYRWVSLFWSECSKLCGKGYMTRRVMCMRTDAETKDTVPDELCGKQKKPLDRDTCQVEPCITWTVTAWHSCSVSCGEGLQQRMVSCALPNLCDPDERPVDKMICNLGTCTHWTVGSWQECSHSCGSGTQQRNVTCINSVTQQVASECDIAVRPMSVQSCNIAQCPSVSAAVNDQAEPCSRNFFNDGICAALRNKGSCSLSYVQRKCCKTCHRSMHLSKPKGES